MRSQGRLAVRTLYYLHKSVRTDFSSVPVHSIRYKGSSYLVTMLLEIVLKVSRAAAGRRHLSAVTASKR